MPEEKKYVIDKPQLMSEWNWEKNKELKITPHTLTLGSNKKVWWKCNKGHEWQSTPKNRKTCGCPICAGKQVVKGYNDLESFYPDVAKSWNYEKNGDLTPPKVTYASNKKVWWNCDICGGEYESYICNRTTRGVGCPYCVGQKVLPGFNDFKTKYPELVVEWSENNIIKPTEVTAHTKKKVFWKCPLGHEDYLMAINQRTRRQGCPVCAKQSQTSFPEQAIYYYIKKVFPDALNRYIYNNHEIDIFIPTQKIGIEYNGYFSHKKKQEKDTKKKDFFSSIGITLLVIKEYKVSEEKKGATYYINERTSFSDLTLLIKNILMDIDDDNGLSVDVDCKRDAITIKNQYIESRKANSIAAVRPDLIDRWDFEKNGKITPEMITLGTGQRFYWKCKICNRTYLALPSKIAEGSVCKNHRIYLKKGVNDLETLYPELLQYWDYEKNQEKPSDVFGGGEKQYYWKCSKGHSYTKSILKHKRGEGCPICAGKKVLAGFNDLETKNPQLAAEWNYARNGEVIPSQVIANSNKKYWWICEHGHEWEAKVSNRMNRRGCPYCSNNKVLAGFNDLETKNPQLATEWNYVKNDDLKPHQVSEKSHKVVWWKCQECQYEWKREIVARSAGAGCPQCYKKKVTMRGKGKDTGEEN